MHRFLIDRTLTRMFLASLLSPVALSAAEFHVAPSGQDGNPGTKEQPFATLEQARDAIRNLKQAGLLTEPVCVVIRGGDYWLEKLICRARARLHHTVPRTRQGTFRPLQRFALLRSR